MIWTIRKMRTLNFSASGELSPMAEEPKKSDPRAEFVRKVARETGISEDQVRYLISMVGYDHSSIVREAGILKQRDA
jgi:hypothetical protein